MSNIIQIKHGWSTPTSVEVLKPHELGFVDSDNRLIIGDDSTAYKEIKVGYANQAVKATDADKAKDAEKLGGNLPSHYGLASSVTSNTQEIGKIAAALTTTNNNLATTDRNLATTNSDLSKIYTNLNKTITDLNTTNANLNTINANLNTTNTNLNSTIANLNTTNVDLKKAVSDIEKLQPEILYNSVSGTTGMVTLSKSAVNFSLLEIIVGYADKVICGNAKIVSPDSKIVDISGSIVGSSKQIGISRTRCIISGNTITQSNNYKTQFSAGNNGTVSWNNSTENILYIYTVIGYK